MDDRRPCRFFPCPGLCYLHQLSHPVIIDRKIQCLGKRVTSQQTRDIQPMLFQCWPTVEDGGPALKQHWVDDSRLLGWTIPSTPLNNKRLPVKESGSKKDGRLSPNPAPNWASVCDYVAA